MVELFNPAGFIADRFVDIQAAVLCRSTQQREHMRAQLKVVRQLLQALLGANPGAEPAEPSSETSALP